MRRSIRSDGGFSVLEVLVALAIASTAMVALSALFQLAIRVSETLATSKRVHTALLDLQGMLQALEQAPGDEVRQADAQSFDLVSSRDDEVVHIALVYESAQSRDLVVSGPSGSTSTALAVFDEAGLEYLHRVEPATLKWIETAPATDTILAARLRLKLGEREWRPLVWIVSPTGRRTGMAAR